MPSARAARWSTSPASLVSRPLRELVEQVFEAAGLPMQLVQRPAPGCGEREDLRSQVARAVGGERDGDAAFGRTGCRRDAANAWQLPQRLRDTRARRLDGDL